MFNSKTVSLSSLAAGLLMGSVLVTACPSAADKGMEWLESDSSGGEEEYSNQFGGPGELVDPGQPTYAISRTLVASEDSSRHVGGFVGTAAGTWTHVADGPFVLTDLLPGEDTGSFRWSIAPTTPNCPVDAWGTLELQEYDANFRHQLMGARVFIPENCELRVWGDATFTEVYWSGYVPYY